MAAHPPGHPVDDGRPVGGRWSFDTENRRRLPRNHPVPAVRLPPQDEDVRKAVAWVGEHFPQAPGRPETFAWPTTHEAAQAWLDQFVNERLAEFGPYEDAIAGRHVFLFHSALTPALNVGLLDPRQGPGERSSSRRRAHGQCRGSEVTSRWR